MVSWWWSNVRVSRWYHQAVPVLTQTQCRPVLAAKTDGVTDSTRIDPFTIRSQEGSRTCIRVKADFHDAQQTHSDALTAFLASAWRIKCIGPFMYGTRPGTDELASIFCIATSSFRNLLTILVVSFPLRRMGTLTGGARACTSARAF